MQLELFSTTKICRKCGIEKSVSEYSKKTESKDGLRSICKQCASIDSKKYRAANREKISERDRRYRAANPDKKRELDRKWKAANPDKIREQNRKYFNNNREILKDKQKAAQRRWKAAHPDKVREQNRKWAHVKSSRRRARKQNAAGNSNFTQINNRKAMYGNQCYLCGNEATAIDHVKPLSKGGSNWPSNLRPICGKCNSSKHAKWPYELPHIPLTRFSEFSQKFN